MSFKSWFPLALIIFIVALLLDMPIVTLIIFSIVLIYWTARWWSNKAFDNIEYTRNFHYTGAFPGEEVAVKIEVENNKILPVSWQRAVGPVDEEKLISSHLPHMGNLHNVYSLRWFEKVKRSYQLKFRARGAYPIGPTKLETGDLFGIFSKEKTLKNIEYLTVFPSLIPLEDLNLPPDDPFGDRKSRKKIFEDPSFPMGIRDYRPRDSFRQVHWPATARTGELKVKVFQPTSAQVLMACMNVSTFPSIWEGYYPELFEYVLSATASILDIGMKDGYQIGLISNGMIANSSRGSRISPGSSPRHLSNLFGALAGVTPFIVGPFERFLMSEMPKIPYGATLVVLTAIIKPELVETLLRIRQHGRRIVLFSFAEELPPEIEGIHTVHLPFKGEKTINEFTKNQRAL